jgi:uncharacterized protein (DUF433 family)
MKSKKNRKKIIPDYEYLSLEQIELACLRYDAGYSIAYIARDFDWPSIYVLWAIENSCRRTG